ncbi:hypothetical protein BC834DRAFT_1029726 [Gloeopeniophorella convolvens]|nr:hypothetical protein BC834DRAFT_1029726 [Gloeopeniophorella convolvens]
MADDADFLLYSLLSETKPELPFFSPLSNVDAPTPDTFDSEFADLDDFEGTVPPLPQPIDDSFATYRGSTPVFTSPSIFTHSTESGYDFAASEYSFHPASNYSLPLDINMAFSNVQVGSDTRSYNVREPMFDPLSGGLQSFGVLPPSPSPSPPVRSTRALSEYMPTKSRHNHYGISPETLSLPRPQPPTIPTILPVQPASDMQPHAGPGKLHQCPNCSRSFGRAFNLKTHMDTHNPERAKPYICPHSSCGRGFSRKHDLQRHRTAIHRDQTSPGSAYSDSSRQSKPGIGVSTGARAWCDKCGKGHVGREATCSCAEVK